MEAILADPFDRAVLLSEVVILQGGHDGFQRPEAWLRSANIVQKPADGGSCSVGTPGLCVVPYLRRAKNDLLPWVTVQQRKLLGYACCGVVLSVQQYPVFIRNLVEFRKTLKISTV